MAKQDHTITRRTAIQQMAVGATGAVAASERERPSSEGRPSGMKIIDAHVHIGRGVQMQHDVDGLLRNMDEAGIDFSIVCPMDRHMAVANREGNDLVLGAVKAHPRRLAGMAVANPWFGASAVEEIRRALGEGLTAVNIHSVLQGFRLADHIVDPILELAAEWDVPVYAHTGTAGLAEPFHLVELARRFPTVNFLMGHAGASDYYNDAVRGLEFAENVWMESSRNGPANFCHWQASGVVDKVVFGSSAPEYIPEIELETLQDVFTETADRERVFGKTIQQVYKGRLPV